MSCILIIDDSESNVALLTRMAEKLDCTIQSFMDPVAGLAWARENDFDLLLVDYHMPGLDGLCFIKEIRSTPQKEAVPILMVSNADQDLLRPALEAGANDFLQKPLNRTEFLARAKSMLTLRENEKVLRQYTATLEEKIAQATQRLKHTHERYRLAALASSDGFWDYDLRRESIYYSDRWFEMIGYRPNDLPHTLDTWFSHVHPNDLPLLQKQLDQLKKGQIDLLNLEVRLYHRKGETLWASVKSLTEKDSDGQIIRLVGAQTDISERKRVEERLARDALHDPLTGLPNRVLFNEHFHQAFARYKRDPHATFALLFLDVDRFKNINDTLGHGVGDELLKTLSRRMTRCCREVDTVARLAGDEFVILLASPSQIENTLDVAKRLVQEINQTVLLNGHEIQPSASIGIASSDPEYETLGDMMRDADLALYEAKEKGRNQFVLFDSTQRAEALKPLRQKEALQKALIQDEFKVYLQGLFNPQTQELCGFEALARWQHPELGIVLPKDFILFAEETGSIADIDRQIFEDSIRQMAAWQKRSGRDLFLTFNLSISALLNISLRENLERAAKTHGIDPQKIILELPEKIAHEGPTVSSKTLRDLKNAGFRIALDDFGATAISLHTLPNLPVDIVKIDRSLVSNIHTNPKNQEILRLVNLIAQDLKLDLVFEGVEIREELDYLTGHFPGLIQGFYFQKPLSIPQIEELYPDLSSRHFKKKA